MSAEVSSEDDARPTNDKAAEVAARLRDDPAHQDRMERLRAAMTELSRDGRGHDRDEIVAALNRHGYTG